MRMLNGRAGKTSYRGKPTIGYHGVKRHQYGYAVTIGISLATLGEGNSTFKTLRAAVRARNKLFRLVGLPIPKKG